MYRVRQLRPASRRGIILLVVLALLTLFAIVGISFVLYANSEANASRYARESESPPQADMDPELLLSMFMGQLIYDTDDDTGIYSALRGHSLARTMYGYYYRRPNSNDGTFPNTFAFSGMGRVRGVPVPPGIAGVPRTGPDSYMNGTQIYKPPFDDYYLINYTYFGKFLRDPERPGYRNGPNDPNKKEYRGGFNPPYTYPDLNNMFLAAVKAGPLELPGVAPDPSGKTAGAVLIQSFHRPWLFGSLKSNNPNWTNDVGKYLILRPRPQEMGPGFPYPEDEGGDVKNLINSPGYLVGIQGGQPKFANNDSIWMDLGAPVMTAPDGTKFKPLFAPLIIDLDNRINVNVHGNIRGRNGAHASNQGWGPWEVNLGRVFNYPGQANEWAQIFTDLSSGATAIEGGRYFYADPTAGHIPLSTFPLANTAPSGDTPHRWGPVDFDACNETQGFGPSARLQTWLAAWQVPGTTGWGLPSFPAVPNGYGGGSQAERQNHPLVFDFFDPFQDPPAPLGTNNPNKRNLVFPVSNMEALLRYGETNSPGLTSALFRLCAQNLGDPNFEQQQFIDPMTGKPVPMNWTGGASRRQLVTTHSFGLDRNGMSPWFWGNNDSLGKGILGFGQAATGGGPVLDYRANPPFFPKALPIPSPPPATNAQQLQGGDFAVAPNAANQLQSDWRSGNGVLGKIDLNRKLTPYPINLRNPNGAFNVSTNPVVVFNLTNPVINAQYQQAKADRENFALDILKRLIVATGAYNPQNPPVDNRGNPISATPQHIYALAYLAQLAVNIVDFIDGDDIMTGLDWLNGVGAGNADFLAKAQAIGFSVSDGTRFVWGTELPRVLLNEVYGEYSAISGDPTKGTATFQVDLWVELYNPLTTESKAADPVRGTAYLRVPGSGTIPGVWNGGAYRLELHHPYPTTPPPPVGVLHKLANPTGEPDIFMQKTIAGGQASACRVDQFVAVGANANVPPADYIAAGGGLYSTLPNPTPGFYVLGPMKPFPQDQGVKNFDPPLPVASYQDPNMSYQLKQGGSDPKTSLTGTAKPDTAPLTIVLQRLANPYIPYNAVTNPFVTIDFLENIHLYLNNADLKTANTDNYTDPNYQQPVNRYSVGKQDPFDSLSSTSGTNNHLWTWNPQLQRNSKLTPPNNNQPQHTFFRHNGAVRNINAPISRGVLGLNLPFSWVPHPDRQLISPMELLTVSAYKPAELTQRFPLVNSTGTGIYGNDARHFAPWVPFTGANPTSADSQSDNNRLFRFFEFVETHDRATGVARGGRIPGLVNINTIWDPETLLALIDPQPANWFTDTDVYKPLAQEKQGAGGQLTPDSIYWRLMQLRSPSVLAGSSPSFNDRPFLGYAPGVVPAGDGQYPQGLGAANSFLRSDAQGRPLFFRPPQFTDADPNDPSKEYNLKQPYNKGSILYKLFNNVSTRSNVFAVWVTVGFFQVTDDTTRPVKLGAEIGKAENRNIRHRMFAIVDRSNLTIDNDPSLSSDPPIFLAANFETNAVVKIAGQNMTVPLYSIGGAKLNGLPNGPFSLSGSYEGLSWQLKKQSWLQMEPVINPNTKVYQSQFRQVADVFPPQTFTTPTGQQVAVQSPTIAFTQALNPSTTSPLYMIPITGTNQVPKELQLGNPGPKPGFNLRNYPWIIRYFSIIH